MKVETYGAPKVENRPRTAPGAPNLTGGGFGELAQGLGSIGHGIDVGAAQHERASEEEAKAKYEADVVAARNAVTELERKKIQRLYEGGGSEVNSGSSVVDAGEQGAVPADPYLSTRGMSAMEQRAGVLKGFDQDTRAIFTGLKNDQQKALFQREAARLSNDMLGTVDSHAARQVEVAKIDSVKAAEASALRQASLDPTNDKAAEDLIAGVTGPARGLASSPAVAEEAALAVRANVTKARLDQLLNGDGDWKSAERVLTKNRAALGADADRYDKTIRTVKAGMEVQQLATSIAANAIDQNRPFSPPDYEKADELIARAPPEQRRAVEQAVNALQAREEHRVQRDQKAFVNAATAAFAKNPAHFFSTPMAERLRTIDSDKYISLQDKLAVRARLARGGRGADKEQKAIDDGAIKAFKSLSTEDQAGTDIEAFLADYAVSDNFVARNPLGPLQRAAKDRVEKGEAVARTAFVNGVKDQLRNDGFAPTDLSTPEKRRAAGIWWATHGARAGDSYDDWLKNHEGKKPSLADLETLKAQVIGTVPPNPKNPRSIDAASRAMTIRGGGVAGPEPVNIPAEERAKVEAALKKRGRAVTEDAVQALYRKAHGG